MYGSIFVCHFIRVTTYTTNLIHAHNPPLCIRLFQTRINNHHFPEQLYLLVFDKTLKHVSSLDKVDHFLKVRLKYVGTGIYSYIQKGTM